MAELHQVGVRIKIIGDRDGPGTLLRTMLDEAEALTRGNSGLKLVVAFNYGSRQEITRAVREHRPARWPKARSVRTTSRPPSIGNHLDTGGLPDPDLLIRTGGEQRLSNYLLWQCAYTEFVFMPEYWPDFDAELPETAPSRSSAGVTGASAASRPRPA